MAHTTTWSVEIFIYEDGDDTTAKAKLVTDTGPSRRHTVTGQGKARRNPADLTVPEIGDEVAVARALRHLADALLRTASDDIAEVEHTEVRLTH